MYVIMPIWYHCFCDYSMALPIHHLHLSTLQSTSFLQRVKLLNPEVQGILDGILVFNLMALIRREYNKTDEVQINF